MKMIESDGINVFFFDWDKRVVSGWHKGIKKGDRMTATMQSGKTAVFEFLEVEYKINPPDQYFAEVKDVGYLNE